MGSGASAATVAAILASPIVLQDAKERKSLRERWKDWKEKNCDQRQGYAEYGTSKTWNVQGVSVRNWGSAEKIKKR